MCRAPNAAAKKTRTPSPAEGDRADRADPSGGAGPARRRFSGLGRVCSAGAGDGRASRPRGTAVVTRCESMSNSAIGATRQCGKTSPTRPRRGWQRARSTYHRCVGRRPTPSGRHPCADANHHGKSKSEPTRRRPRAGRPRGPAGTRSAVRAAAPKAGASSHADLRAAPPEASAGSSPARPRRGRRRRGTWRGPGPARTAAGSTETAASWPGPGGGPRTIATDPPPMSGAPPRAAEANPSGSSARPDRMGLPARSAGATSPEQLPERRVARWAEVLRGPTRQRVLGRADEHEHAAVLIEREHALRELGVDLRDGGRQPVAASVDDDHRRVSRQALRVPRRSRSSRRAAPPTSACPASTATRGSPREPARARPARRPRPMPAGAGPRATRNGPAVARPSTCRPCTRATSAVAGTTVRGSRRATPTSGRKGAADAASATGSPIMMARYVGSGTWASPASVTSGGPGQPDGQHDRQRRRAPLAPRRGAAGRGPRAAP